MEKQIEEKEIILGRSLRQCYEDGRKGAEGYPLDPKQIIEEAQKRGEECSAFVRGFIAVFVGSMNAEYERGRKEMAGE